MIKGIVEHWRTDFGEHLVCVYDDPAGTDFVRVYLDQPGPGTLVASHMPAAGVDQWGNPYPGGYWHADGWALYLRPSPPESMS